VADLTPVVRGFADSAAAAAMQQQHRRRQQRTSWVAAQQVLAAVLVNLGQCWTAQAGWQIVEAGTPTCTAVAVLQHMEQQAAL
jgi:hypothetical protein